MVRVFSKRLGFALLSALCISISSVHAMFADDGAAGPSNPSASARHVVPAADQAAPLASHRRIQPPRRTNDDTTLEVLKPKVYAPLDAPVRMPSTPRNILTYKDRLELLKRIVPGVRQRLCERAGVPFVESPWTPTFTFLANEDYTPFLRVAFNVLYHLDPQHTYLSVTVPQVTEGGNFPKHWRFAGTCKALKEAFLAMHPDQQARLVAVWDDAEAEEALYWDKKETTRLAVFPFRGAQEDYYLYSAARASFIAVSRTFEKARAVEPLALEIFPADPAGLPRQDEDIAKLTGAMERLYRYGLTFEERAAFQKYFQELLRQS